MYFAMNRKKDTYSIDFHSKSEAVAWYDDHKKYITQEGSPLYDTVLVEAPRTRVGHEIKVRIFWHRYMWVWKPELKFQFGFRFTWLGLWINAGGEYFDIPGKIIRDHNAPEVL